MSDLHTLGHVTVFLSMPYCQSPLVNSSINYATIRRKISRQSFNKNKSSAFDDYILARCGLLRSVEH